MEHVLEEFSRAEETVNMIREKEKYGKKKKLT